MNSLLPSLIFPPQIWRELLNDLRRRGHGERESGAFLLGCQENDVRHVGSWICYEDLDSNAHQYDYIRLDTSAFPSLWAACAERSMQVVADVHTHPYGPRQSESDRENPMIAIAGHIALIVPRYATEDVQPADLSFNVYQGGGHWESLFRDEAARHIILEKE